MKTVKIDILKPLTFNVLCSRMLVLSSNFARKRNYLIEDKTAFMQYCEDVAKENFIFPVNKKESVVCSLALFFLGDKNNPFDKLFDQLSPTNNL